MQEKKNLPISPEQARKILWNKGIITFKLDPNQIELYNSYLNAKTKTIVWGCSRRLGKSYTLCVIAIQMCLQRKNAIVKYLAPKQKDVKTIIRPLMRQLIADSPEEIRPIEKTAAGVWYFPSTGSEIQIAGCDNGRAESVRGGGSDLCIVDEAGFTNDLEYIVKSILLPTTTTTHGKIILASTPPKSPSHEFVKFIRKAEYEGSFVKKTIYDNPRLTKEDIDELADSVGGKESVEFRREYLAQVITDEQRAVVPEFNDEAIQEIVTEWKRPPFYDAYTAMDLGIKDLTVVLFAYYDFRAGKLIIEDEFVLNGQKFTTQALAQGIREKESNLLTDPLTNEFKPPHVRVSDNNLIVINDLYHLHGLTFIPTRKDDADAALNNMRILVKDRRIIIHPRCITLIRHLQNGIWNKSKSSYERSEDNGHFDAIDSLKYLVRNVDFTKNPYPRGYNLPSGENAYYLRRVSSPHLESMKKIMNIKR